MTKRNRNIQLLFWVTPEEKKLIRRKMTLSRTANMSAYLRKMAIDGIIVNTDTTYLEKQYYESTLGSGTANFCSQYLTSRWS